MSVRTGLHNIKVFLWILFPVELPLHVRGVKAKEREGNIFYKEMMDPK